MVASKTHFGFKEVESTQKASMVGEVFTSVAGKYDIMNDVMSMGVHRLWKDQFVKSLPNMNGKHILDMAAGTGDIADRIQKRYPNSHVVLCDINYAMIYEGKLRSVDTNQQAAREFACTNAEILPYADHSFDAYTISFGIRNVTDIPKALKEAYRVLKPGGKFMCLEFSKVTEPLAAKLYEGYSFGVIPKMGELVAGDRDSYQYLVESIRQFPDQETFKTMLEQAGFERCSYKNMSLGAVAIHSGWKL